jgi:adenylate cyclase
VLDTKGEIYQYVGDEMVVSWSLKDGLEKGNCINCFFGIQRALQDKKSEFLSEYEVAPEFKAGMHMGYVMSGEIGVVKREIAYSGDVLNTTARIQSKCNEFGVDILVSEALMRNLPESSGTKGKSLGFIPLRGKEHNLELYTL